MNLKTDGLEIKYTVPYMDVSNYTTIHASLLNSSSVFFPSTHMLQVIGREMLTTMFWSNIFAS